MSRLSPRWTAVFPAALLLLAASLACRAGIGKGSKADPEAPIVKINGQAIPCREFEAYLEATLGKEVPSQSEAEMRSQLLDQFIEERLLLQEARARKMQVPEEQVETYLAGLAAGTEGSPDAGATDEGFREQIRNNLLIRGYKDRVLLKDVGVEPAEVESYYRTHPQEFLEARVLILRQILLDDASEATKLRETLRENPGQFETMAEARSVSPDKGQPRPYEEGDLPESVRAAVFALEPGQISDVVEEGGKYRVFQVIERHEGKNQSLEEVRRKIEVLLLQNKAQEALSRALAGIRQSSKIEVLQGNLPFRYTGEYRG